MKHKDVEFLILARPGRDQWTYVISYPGWIEYVEKHYRGGKLESSTTFACRPVKPEIREEDWKEGGRKL